MIAKAVQEVRAWGYGRISRAPDKQQYSKETQADAIRGYWEHTLKKLGVVYHDAFFFDEDVSGGKRFFTRPAAGLLDREMMRGDHLIMARLDRGFRNAEDGAKTIRILREDRGIVLHFLDLQIDTTTAAGKFILNNFLSVGQYWRDVTIERNREQALRAMKKGLPRGGSVPIGWEKRGKGPSSYFIPNFEERAFCESLIGTGLSSRELSRKHLFRGQQISERGIRWIWMRVREGYPLNKLGVRVAGRPASCGQNFPQTSDGGLCPVEAVGQ